MLKSAMPCYQSGLRNRICYEIKFNEYGKVINATRETPNPDATYEIKDISLEYEIVTQLDLARNISEEYQRMVLLCDRVVRDIIVPVNKSDTNWPPNKHCKSVKGILVLFEEEQPYALDTSKFYNPKVEKVFITVEGKTNQMYSKGLRLFEQIRRNL